MSLKGSRQDNFFFCLIEYFPDSDRWFLKSVLRVKDEQGITSGDEAVGRWLERFGTEHLVVDFPLSKPACQDCTLKCPGMQVCPDKSVVDVQKRILKLLGEDQKNNLDQPKHYERERNRDDEFDAQKDMFQKSSDQHLLSRSFKRRLKKGYLPYWNRPLDLWVWCKYYDQLLDLFNISFDSFGTTSLMVLSRMSYLKHQFPAKLKLYESNINILLIELLRNKIIQKRDLISLSDLEESAVARLDIIKKIEKALNIFIYDHDLELVVSHPRAFESFLLAIVGQRMLQQKIDPLPTWAGPDESRFLVPSF